MTPCAPPCLRLWVRICQPFYIRYVLIIGIECSYIQYEFSGVMAYQIYGYKDAIPILLLWSQWPYQSCYSIQYSTLSKVFVPTKYPCSDCAIYRLNIQMETKMVIEIYR